MQDTKLITLPNNNNSSQPQAIQEQSTVLSFHDRAIIVVRDILEQVGIDENKILMITQVTSMINSFPPFGPMAKAQNMIKDIEPLLFAIQNNLDPGSYLKAVPAEKIEYFINQVITRLEWIKYGNSEPETASQEQQASNNKTADNNS